MKKIYSVVGCVLLAGLLAGCATSGPNQTAGTIVGAATGAIIGGSLRNNPGDALIGGTIGALIGALAGKDIDNSVRQRVEKGQPLTLEDVKALTQAKVEDDLIISQIKSTRTVYKLTSAQIIDLKNAGVSQKVIQYMINTKTATTTTTETVVVPVPVAPVPIVPGPDIFVPVPGPPPPHHHPRPWRP